MTKIFEPFIYLIAWLYFHGKVLIETIVSFGRGTSKIKVKLDIHTFIGAGLAVFYYYLFTGGIEQFHGFHDALPLIVEYAPAARGTGFVFEIAIASVLFIIFSRGLLLLFGYSLIFWIYIILSSFETPQPVEPKVKEYASVLVRVQK